MFEDLIKKEVDDDESDKKPLHCQNPKIQTRFPECGNGVDTYCSEYLRGKCTGFGPLAERHSYRFVPEEKAAIIWIKKLEDLTKKAKEPKHVLRPEIRKKLKKWVTDGKLKIGRRSYEI